MMIDAPKIGAEVVIAGYTEPPLTGKVTEIVAWDDDYWRVKLTTSGNQFEYTASIVRRPGFLNPVSWALVDGRIRAAKEGA